MVQLDQVDSDQGKIVLHVICEQDCGLFALIQQVITHIDWALNEGRIPIVYFKHRCCYWTPKGYRGRDNVWEYYFEPVVKDYSSSYIPLKTRKKINEAYLAENDTGFFIDEDVYVCNHYGEKLKNKAMFIPYDWADPDKETRQIGGVVDKGLREKCSIMIRKYIRPRSYIEQKIEDFYNTNIKGNYVIGVHIRGTDSVSKREKTVSRKGALKYKRYLNCLNEILKEEPYAKIFVATDDQNSLNFMRDNYGSRVVAYDSIRHKEGKKVGFGPLGQIMPAYITGDNEIAAKNGEDAVIEYLLLCKCNILVHNGARLARVALLTTTNLKDINTHHVNIIVRYLFILLAKSNLYAFLYTLLVKSGRRLKRIKKFIKSVKFYNKLLFYRNKIVHKTTKNFKKNSKKFYKKRLFYRKWILKEIPWQINYLLSLELKSAKNKVNNFLVNVLKNAKPKKLILGRYNKIFIITVNHSNAGFFALITFVLNQLNYCEKNRYLPVVYFGKDSVDGPNAYYDQKYGENVWDYYFEPVSHYTYDEIINMGKDPDNSITEMDLAKLDINELWYLHEHYPWSVYAYPYGFYGYKKNFDKKWYKRKRTKANYYINKYVSIKKHILDEINTFYNDNMNGRHVIGIHIRGTDKGVADSPQNLMKIIKPEYYVKEIDKYLEAHPDCKIYVATDQEQYLEYMINEYGERIIFYPSKRSDSKLAPFQIRDGSNYSKGKDVLIECLLLSRCQFLLKCTSAVGEAAHWFNPDLESIDMNYLY